jgi:hypothetical protein
VANSNFELRDSIERTRDALRRGERSDAESDASELAPDDADRREAVRSAVANFRAASDEGTALAQIPSLHPFFQGLLDILPPPGCAWPEARRDQWLETARNIFGLLYLERVDAPPSLRPVPESTVSDISEGYRPETQRFA